MSNIFVNMFEIEYLIVKVNLKAKKKKTINNFWKLKKKLFTLNDTEPDNVFSWWAKYSLVSGIWPLNGSGSFLLAE